MYQNNMYFSPFDVASVPGIQVKGTAKEKRQRKKKSEGDEG